MLRLKFWVVESATECPYRIGATISNVTKPTQYEVESSAVESEPAQKIRLQRRKCGRLSEIQVQKSLEREGVSLPTFNFLTDFS